MSFFDGTKGNASGFFGKKHPRTFADPKYTDPEGRRETRQKIALERIIAVLERQARYQQ
jgi:hypothetical protein